MLIDLCGTWTVSSPDNGHSLLGSVPGCIHTDLISANLLADPFIGLNELDALWVADHTWTYTRTFNVSSVFKDRKRIELRCNGLDTLTEITINGNYVGKTSNMFRVYEFVIGRFIKVGENTIAIKFRSATKYAKMKLDERWLANWGVPEGDKLPGVNYLRKAQCHFGWDWGPKLATCGIWRPIEIRAFANPVIEEIYVRQKHLMGGESVQLCVTVKMRLPCVSDENSVPANFWCKVQVRRGEVLCGQDCTPCFVQNFSKSWAKSDSDAMELDEVRLTLSIPSPEFWWPNGMGNQNLYDVIVTIQKEQDFIVDESSKRIGLRTLKLVRQPDQWGQSFHFEVNGVPFFAKGGNWIPADAFPSRVSAHQYQVILQHCAKANMNMIRVWGGGIYEDFAFYEACDRLGICVWQDFMFACAAYPVFDKEWLANVKEEASQNVKRLRHHACIALWCGNNELEQGLVDDEYSKDTMSWADYSLLFDDILRDIVQKLDNDADYWPGSPHSPIGNREAFNNPKWGDAHLWGVWHGREPFEWYRRCEHRFNSEFGFQSFPDIHTLRTYVPRGERNITSRTAELHQRSGIGNQTIVHYMLDWFRLPNRLENLLWASQITQGIAIKYAVEHWRRSMPRGMGTLYWQVNDCWPVASWSSIDYYGSRKALHFMAAEMFSPVLISGEEDNEKRTVQLHLTNDSQEALEGQVCWEIWATHSESPLASGSKNVTARALGSASVCHIKISPLPSDHLSLFQTLVFYWFEDSSSRIRRSENTSIFVRPKHLELIDPELSWNVRQEKKNELVTNWVVDIFSKRCALWVFVDDSSGKFQGERSFFHVTPQTVPVSVALQTRIVEQHRTESELRWTEQNIKVYSLFDLMEYD